MKQREWLGHPVQRVGSAVLHWWEGDRYLGPTEASRYPRETPWLFRGDNDVKFVVVMCVIIAIWINI